MERMVAALLILWCLACSAQATEQTLEILVWPLSASTARPFAAITYEPETFSAKITDYTPFVTSRTEEAESPLIRLGHYHRSETRDESTWSGVALPPQSFAANVNKTLRLLVNDDGRVYHIGLSTTDAVVSRDSSERRDKEVLYVEVVKPVPGPQPFLNKPVIVNEHGQVEEKVPEQSFLRKWWWAIGLFLLVQVVMGGSGVDEKK